MPRCESQRKRTFEAAIGAHLATLPGDLYYWSKGTHEVDFVRECDGVVTAYEVKSGITGSVSGLMQFKKLYPHALIEIVLVRKLNSSAAGILSS